MKDIRQQVENESFDSWNHVIRETIRLEIKSSDAWSTDIIRYTSFQMFKLNRPKVGAV